MSQQAVSERLRTFPAALFRAIVVELLPQMQARWATRTRPIAEVLRLAQAQFGQVLILDGSTLDALLKKVGLLRGHLGPLLAGRMAALLDANSRLPLDLWYEEDSQAHDLCFWQQAVARLPRGVLLLFDLGFTKYAHFEALGAQGIFFITRCKSKAAFQVAEVLQHSGQLQDRIIRLGSKNTRCQQIYRLVEVAYKGLWYRYLTNVLDPQCLSAAEVAQLYQQRWRIEDAFFVTKRLLGLAYFYVGSLNGVQIQIWCTWLLYSLLVDLTDRVADLIGRPFGEVSMEMVFKGLYHFTQEKHLGRADDPVAFLVLTGFYIHCSL